MSSNYGKSERVIARALGAFPGVKAFVKRQYQRVNAVIYRKKYKLKTNLNINILPVQGETFYGYYDHSPESEDRRFILFHLSDGHPTTDLPDPAKPIYVGVFDVEYGQVVYQKFTNTYNWQQGSRLQWLGPRHFIYNNYDEDRGYHSVLVEIKGSEFEETTIPLPVYDAFRTDFALTLDFNRLNQMRPDYGYRNEPDAVLPSYGEDGIFYVDLKTGLHRLLVSIERLVNLQANGYMKQADHKVNHIMVSPDGRSFIFLHRYFYNGRRFDRLVVSNIDGDKLTVLADDEMVSHCYWINEREVVAYLRVHTLGDKYYKINIEDGTKSIIGEGLIDRFGDGHPMVMGHHLVFDTYPNKSRMKNLFHFDLEAKQLRKLGEFFESMRYYGETRCDLHPRLNPARDKVFFDSVHTGKRSLYWIDI